LEDCSFPPHRLLAALIGGCAYVMRYDNQIGLYVSAAEVARTADRLIREQVRQPRIPFSLTAMLNAS